MTGTIGCIGLIGIAVFIILLALWSRKSRQDVVRFYEENMLALAPCGPDSVMVLIGSPNLTCRRGSVKLETGEVVNFYWWEWYTSSTLATTNTRSTTLNCFLAISFDPDSVSEQFRKIATTECEQGKSFTLKNALKYDTSTPYRVETLDDGIFVVFWRVLQRPQIMEQKIEWLKKNLSVKKSNPIKSSKFVVVQADIDLALMMMQQDGDFIASEVQTYTYFILAPKAFATELFENTLREVGKIYLEHQSIMTAREPDDPNYITVVGARPKLLSEAEVAAEPWLSAKVPMWEESVCIAIREDRAYKLSPTFFTGAVKIEQ